MSEENETTNLTELEQSERAREANFQAWHAAEDRVGELERELEAMRKVVTAVGRYLELNSSCDYTDGTPDVCPGIAEIGTPCHWCELRTAYDAAAQARQDG